MSVATSTDHPAVLESHPSIVASYLDLTKARLSLLVVVTTAAGYGLALDGAVDWLRLAWTLVGTGLAAGCAAALNQLVEVEHDRRMPRTQTRPLVTGAISRRSALFGALLMGILGIAMLATLVNVVAASLALITIVLYVAVYTPLKRRTTLNTLVGAVCGGIPPMIGWAAVTGGIQDGAWWLGAILFIWQLPHFLALAWLYRDDYRLGGFVMLPSIEGTRELTGRAIVILSFALIPLGLLGTLMGLTGWVFAIGSVLLGAWMLWLSVQMWREPTNDRARRVFFGSIIYLPALLALLVVG